MTRHRLAPDRISRRAALALLSALAATGLASPACAKEPAGEPIKVGHYASMTGKEATFGQSTDNGIRLAIEEINAAGGVNGRPIEIITYDTKGESREAGAAVTRLITSDKVAAVLGEDPTPLVTEADADVPMFVPG